MTSAAGQPARLLRGADLTELGEVAVTAVDDHLAIGLTRGAHQKAYRYTDPNEDVVAVLHRAGLTALVVADGHRGIEASHAVVPAVLGRLDAGASLVDRADAARLLHSVNAGLAANPQGRSHSRTTLSVAVLVEGASLAVAAVGDSPVVVVRRGRVIELTRYRPRFLGEALTPTLVAGAMEHVVLAVEEGDVVVTVTDGYSNFAPMADLAELVAVGDAESAVRAILARAARGGAGDNVAAAVLRLG